MHKAVCIRLHVSLEEAREFINNLKGRRPLREGDTVVYYVYSAQQLWWGKLKWGKCKWVGSNICRTIACNGGLYLGPKEDKTCAGFRGKLFIVPMSYEEMLVHML